MTHLRLPSVPTNTDFRFHLQERTAGDITESDEDIAVARLLADCAIRPDEFDFLRWKHQHSFHRQQNFVGPISARIGAKKPNTIAMANKPF